MSSLTSADTEQVLQRYRRLRADDKLALLWYVYREMGQSVTPAAPGAAEPAIADGLYEQVKSLPQPAQLEVQREIVRRADTRLAREYGSLSANTKLLFWYRLAQGMENGEIISMPDDYSCSEAIAPLIVQTQSLSFQSQITFLRQAVVEGGSEPRPGSDL
ncbi:MAG: Orange carotenoid protein [Spirulinaceae cyanobacterium RM2_2_10]|nr:Orange carotenoid protein [Spirulinaceae cyanobacterium SM2_1_0]NJO21094.1 Orange carotenoid protein [Spirulinaceae cyanobacterium RM2_2_10]